MDVSGEQGGDISLAKNGHLHKTRLDSRGQRMNVAEYISPRHWGFTLHKPRAVCPMPIFCTMMMMTMTMTMSTTMMLVVFKSTTKY